MIIEKNNPFIAAGLSYFNPERNIWYLNCRFILFLPMDGKANSLLLGIQLCFSFNLLYINIYSPENWIFIRRLWRRYRWSHFFLSLNMFILTQYNIVYVQLFNGANKDDFFFRPPHQKNELVIKTYPLFVVFLSKKNRWNASRLFVPIVCQKT